MSKSYLDFKLTDGVTVRELLYWIDKKDDVAKIEIINFIYHRFENRYIKHVRDIDSGFTRMAIGCLMIETLESFKLGYANTKNKSVTVFQSFFETENKFFPGFGPYAKIFHRTIRCGILHQAETTEGWRILRSGKLLDIEGRAINAKIFIDKLSACFDNYLEQLHRDDFTSILWKHAIKKLISICDDCKVT